MKPTTLPKLSHCILISVLLPAALSMPDRVNAQPATNPPSGISDRQSGQNDTTLTGPGAAMKDWNFKMLTSDDALEGEKAHAGAWLGLATEEASEALTSQLRLDPGVGLVVTYVATNSPAAKAGLVRDDVLVGFEDQSLVHPQQLRKLVQVRKDGDTVKLAYYRAGQRETVSVLLAKAPERRNWINMGDWQKDGPRWEQYRKDLQEHMEHLKQSLGDVHIDQKQMQDEVRHGMDQARRAAEDALRNASNDLKNLGPSTRALEELARGWIGVRKDATVTVNSMGGSVQTLVKSDDSGIYVLVANPRKHLTVHDPAGKLVFDGEIETPAQQAAVPKPIWDKARPLADKMTAAKSKTTELESED